MHVVVHGVDVNVRVEFASDTVVHNFVADARIVVTYDVASVPGMFVHDDLEDLCDDLLVV